MASHRKPRPGGSQQAGVHAPTLAAAALTSMAVFSQPAEPALTTGQGIPTPEEIARKIDDFYRQAETALEASTETNGARERWGRGMRGVRAARGGRTESERARSADERGRGEQGGSGERHRWTESERARSADEPGRGERDGKRGAGAGQDGRGERSGPGGRDGSALGAGGGERFRLAAAGGREERDGRGSWRVRGERDGRIDGSGRGERAWHADAGGDGPRVGSAGRRGNAGRGGGAGRATLPEPTGWTALPEPAGRDGLPEPAGRDWLPEPAGWAASAGWAAPSGSAETPRTAEGSLQRLRDEVARRARQRSLPAARGVIPAQRAMARQETAQRGRGPAQGGTGPGQAERGTGEAGRATAPAGSPAVTAPAGSPAVIAPPLQATAPPRAMPATPAMPTTLAMPATPAAQAAVGVAVPSGSRPEPGARRLDTTARRPDTPVGGPKAAKVVTRDKLTHARVLLSQRIARTPGTPSGTYATKAGKAVAFARAQLGKPCVWGAAGPGSYDCAGLTQAAWKSAGVTLPRTAPEQAGVGVPVPPDEARPGDLVFFHDDAGHVGLCTGNGMMIHAPRPGAYVREQPVSALGEGTVHSVVRPG